jgi:hypothetical protein
VKRKRRFDGRSGDEAVTRREVQEGLVCVDRRLRERHAAGECLLRSC